MRSSSSSSHNSTGGASRHRRRKCPACGAPMTRRSRRGRGSRSHRRALQSGG